MHIIYGTWALSQMAMMNSFPLCEIKGLSIEHTKVLGMLSIFFLQNLAYYARIILYARATLLFPKLCQHNVDRPSPRPQCGMRLGGDNGDGEALEEPWWSG